VWCFAPEATLQTTQQFFFVNRAGCEDKVSHILYPLAVLLGTSVRVRRSEITV